MGCDPDKLAKAIGGPGRLLIVTHDNPDPDALVTAAALARFASATADVKSRICCEGVVGRAENRALKRELRLKLMDATRVSWKRWPKIALVDCQPGTGNNAFPEKRAPDVVLDHHPLRKSTRARMTDVRSDYGACATLMAEYLQAASISVPSDLAAGLCYAIASETQDLSRDAGAADAEAYMRLYQQADKKMLSRIMHPQLQQEYFSTLARALRAAMTHGNIVIAHLDEVTHPDSVGLVADLLLQRIRITWSLVTGVWKGDLYISLRTERGYAHAGRILRRVLGARGSGGGHSAMAGGRATLKGLDAQKKRELPGQLAQRLIRIVTRRKDASLKPLLDDGAAASVCKPLKRDV